MAESGISRENDIGSHGLTGGKPLPNDSIAAMVGLGSIMLHCSRLWRQADSRLQAESIFWYVTS